MPQRAEESMPAWCWATSKLKTREISAAFLWSSYVASCLYPLPSQTTHVLSFKAYSSTNHTWQKQWYGPVSPPNHIRKDEDEQSTLLSTLLWKAIELLEVKFSSLSIQQDKCGWNLSTSFSTKGGLSWVTLARKDVWDGRGSSGGIQSPPISSTLIFISA